MLRTNSFKLDPSRAIHGLSDIFVVEFLKKSPFRLLNLVHCVFVFLMDGFVETPQILGPTRHPAYNISTILQPCYRISNTVMN